MKNNAVIKILFVENSVEDAEQIISLIRNAGIAVRPARATNADDFKTALDDLRPDLVLFNSAISSLPLREVAKLIDSSGRDVSLVANVSQLDGQSVSSLFADGVHGVALRSQPRQFVTVVQREFEALNTRRQVRRLESALRESERRCDALLDSSNDAIAYVHEGMHVRANRSYLDTFGYDDFDDLLGLPILDLISSEHADALKGLLKDHSRDEKAPPSMELQARRADGSSFPATIEFAHATFEGEACLQVVFRRQLVDPALVEHLQRDAVTGLYVRARTLEFIDEAVASAAEGLKGQALLLVEPDNWTNAIAGIGLGRIDDLLHGIAGLIDDLLGPDDIAGLMAEHTFGILLHSSSDEAIKAWIAQLQQQVANRIFDAGERSISLTISIGGSLLAEKNANAELLLNQASTALRSAQGQGGNRNELHDPTAREKADEERERNWLAQIRQALEQDDFVLHHQHIISLQDADGDYSEILLRMHGPQGEVQPGIFMPIAEKHGLTAAIDRWVLDKAISALTARDAHGGNTTFFVKLTTESLQEPGLLPWLAQRLKQANLKRGQIVLEMTESRVVTLLRPAQEFVSGWKKIGGRFALEQFGSGLNSFQLLGHIEADYLKIDRTYMAGLPQHPENQQKIAEICQQSHEMKKQVVAEWVEDAASTSLLFACGVDFVQGNFLQEPQLLVL
ncbi:EAL domain-containing protein [Dyella sp. A6]|uniref:EAL domain-containing response regulator n=1 Tax=Dyella aluminiiresistens TaxID=3069105 RepID=UPI002E7846DD|nr:EAL domain-containing protein [Dyella sp. A6]